MIDFDMRSAEAVRPKPAGSNENCAPQSALPAPGWYGDPHGSQPLRYWNGTAWADGGTDGPPE